MDDLIPADRVGQVALWIRTVGELAEERLADTTNGNYMAVRQRIVRFAQSALGVPPSAVFPAKPGSTAPQTVITAWVGSLICQNKPPKAESIRNYLCAVRDWHVGKQLSLATCPSAHPDIRNALTALGRRQGVDGGFIKRAVPISTSLFVYMLCALNPARWLPHQQRLARRDRAMIALGFVALLRKKELISLRRKDVHIVRQSGLLYILLDLHCTKASQAITLKRHIAPRTANGVDVLGILQDWLACLPPDNNTPLLPALQPDGRFVCVDGRLSALSHASNAVSKRIQKIVKRAVELAQECGWDVPIEATHYTSHSLRRGGRNALREAGISRELRQIFGRWASEAGDIYDEWSIAETLSLTASIGRRPT